MDRERPPAAPAAPNRRRLSSRRESRHARAERELHEAMYATIQATHHSLVLAHRWTEHTRDLAPQHHPDTSHRDDPQYQAALDLQAALTGLYQESHRLYVAARTHMSEETEQRLTDLAEHAALHGVHTGTAAAHSPDYVAGRLSREREV